MLPPAYTLPFIFQKLSEGGSKNNIKTLYGYPYADKMTFVPDTKS